MPIIKFEKESLEDVIPLTGSCIVDYYADWCGPCKTVTPVLERIGVSDDITVIKVDVDKYPQLATSAAVASIPTLDIYKDGVKSNTLKGAQPEHVIRAAL